MEEQKLYFTRFQIINAILSAQDNGDKEYMELLRLFQSSTHDSDTFINSFLVTDSALADYINTQVIVPNA